MSVHVAPEWQEALKRKWFQREADVFQVCASVQRAVSCSMRLGAFAPKLSTFLLKMRHYISHRFALRHLHCLPVLLPPCALLTVYWTFVCVFCRQ